VAKDSKPENEAEKELTLSSTQVDLGDDLLDAKTRVLELELGTNGTSPSLFSSPAKAEPARALEPAQIPEQFQGASILLREGMLEEAKRVLRKILLVDERHAPSRKLLEEIHERELKQMFAIGAGAEEPPSRQRRARGGRDPHAAAGDEDPDLVLDALDRELGLGLAKSALEPPPLTLFREFEAENPVSVPDIQPRDRIDLGIAFMEMGFVQLAVRQFEFACKAIMLAGEVGEGSEDKLLAATGLLARAQLEAGHPFEATLNIEPLLRDTDVPHGKKLELLYLMGRAFEELRLTDQASRWYAQVSRLDPEYRDVRARVQILREKTRS
jgi:tetratricopeptide (TPR) repeat protein